MNTDSNNRIVKRDSARWALKELTYCANAHACMAFDALKANLETFFTPVCELRQQANMHSGLWFSNAVVNEILAEPNKLVELKEILQQRGVNLTSLNGFPYGDFHADEVKESVYLPDWADAKRLIYTQNLALILATCMPDNIDKGAISTLPLGYKLHWQPRKNKQAIDQLITLCQFLSELEAQTGKQIQIGLEMEPDCVLESTHELVDFFHQQLLPQALLVGISKMQLLRYIGCCYDTCHQAVKFEDTHTALTQITNANIEICKIQISNAPIATLHNKEDIQYLCTLFQDAKFMHQCTLKSATGELTSFNDLNETQLMALFNHTPQAALPLTCCVHYHVPIHMADIASPEKHDISTTQFAIISTLSFLQQKPALKPYIEIETYTWLNFLKQVSKDQIPLVEGLFAEFVWLEKAMKARRLIFE